MEKVGMIRTAFRNMYSKGSKIFKNYGSAGSSGIDTPLPLNHKITPQRPSYMTERGIDTPLPPNAKITPQRPSYMTERGIDTPLPSDKN